MQGVSFLILIMKKTNVILGILIFVLVAAIVAINIGFGGKDDRTSVNASEYVETLSPAEKLWLLMQGTGEKIPEQ